MTLHIEITKRHAGFTLNVALDAAAGITALFGRSGAGKTSIINAVAGILQPDEGIISLNGETLFDSANHVNLPVHQRRMGYVFQEARLFPHLTVLQNLTYGGTYQQDRTIALLGLEKLLQRRPATLSGGEAQRVAIGRALMRQPRLLLMDEPLAALDTARKEEILPYIAHLRDEMDIPVLFVSHAMSEVARLADTLVLLGDGQVLRAGPAAEVLSDPAAVPFVGVQDAGAILNARVSGFDAARGLTELRFDGGTIRLPGKIGAVNSWTRVRVNAGDVILARSRPDDISALNILPVTISRIVPGQGPGVAVGLQCGGSPLLARITKASLMGLALQEGQSIFAIIKANAIAPGDIGSATALDFPTPAS